MKKLLFFIILFAMSGVIHAQDSTRSSSGPIIGLRDGGISSGAIDVKPTTSSEWVSAQPSELLPLGSYQETCTNITFDGSTLKATCKNDEQQDIEASLSGVGSEDFIINMNGKLVVAPKGPYTKTCKDIRLFYLEGEGLILTALCQTDEDGYRGSPLRGIKEGDIIINDNGKLVKKTFFEFDVKQIPSAPPIRALTKAS